MLLDLRVDRYRYLSMGVDLELIIFMARITWVSMFSITWGMRPVRFFVTRSSGVNDVPVWSQLLSYEHTLGMSGYSGFFGGTYSCSTPARGGPGIPSPYFWEYIL